MGFAGLHILLGIKGAVEREASEEIHRVLMEWQSLLNICLCIVEEPDLHLSLAAAAARLCEAPAAVHSLQRAVICSKGAARQLLTAVWLS